MLVVWRGLFSPSSASLSACSIMHRRWISSFTSVLKVFFKHFIFVSTKLSRILSSSCFSLSLSFLLFWNFHSEARQNCSSLLACFQVIGISLSHWCAQRVSDWFTPFFPKVKHYDLELKLRQVLSFTLQGYWFKSVIFIQKWNSCVIFVLFYINSQHCCSNL